MRHYKHLTRYERENLLFLRAKGYSITAIAESMGRNKGTISRELRRNSVANQYMPVVAQHQYQARRAYCKPHNRLEHARLLEHVIMTVGNAMGLVVIIERNRLRLVEGQGDIRTIGNAI